MVQKTKKNQKVIKFEKISGKDCILTVKEKPIALIWNNTKKSLETTQTKRELVARRLNTSKIQIRKKSKNKINDGQKFVEKFVEGSYMWSIKTLSATPPGSDPQKNGFHWNHKYIVLTKPQCYTHRSGVKCVQDNTCPCQAANCPYNSGCSKNISTTRALCGPLLHQGSRTTWVKPSRRPKNPPWYSAKAIVRSYFTQKHRSSHPSSSQKETNDLPYWRAPTPPMWPHKSPRMPPLTPSHQQP